ncbi:GreA/GreB family elongation factor [Flintibacter muris]|uniref:GreA/GreB family elongation factor n=1 Tax=Flintibacter muris TaxID=2941327 RepID=UPI002040DBDD|nr:GreA/GreB family elongation factor [Flintibacter muris]
MHNELTKTDIKKMREELDYRRITLRPQLLEEVKIARGFGDLSENFEYKAAKQEKNKNESRIRYLENMIKTARIIEDSSDNDTVGLYDKVTIWLEEDEEEETWQVVTTVRQNVSHGLISKESPMGSALMGRKVGDRFYVQVNKDFGYWAQVRSIVKGQDDGSAALNRF